MFKSSFENSRREPLKIANEESGGFIISKNISSGIPVRYSFREESQIPQLNWWIYYFFEEDDEYVVNSSNFEILSAQLVYKLSPLILQLFNVPYGTDLCWLYESDVLTGCYSLANDRKTTMSEILNC